MQFRSLIPLVFLMLCMGGFAVEAHERTSDSLQNLLTKTSDPKQRIALLLNLKDLNEDTELNVPLSIQLFREAVRQNDTYAMAVAYIPILNRYATHAEKEDSLIYYMRVLRNTTPGTRQDGICAYSEMNIAFSRILGSYTFAKRHKVASAVVEWCDENIWEEDIHHQIKRLLSSGIAHIFMKPDSLQNQGILEQADKWMKADSTANLIKELHIKLLFKRSIYNVLSRSYSITGKFDKLDSISHEMITLLDQYFAEEAATGRRPYQYINNAYVVPYRQLMLSAHTQGQKTKVRAHYDALKRRMLVAKDKNLLRNKSLLYEFGYQWLEQIGSHDRAILYCDSLINIIDSGKRLYKLTPIKIENVYRARGRLLYKLGHYDQALTAYQRTYDVVDSLNRIERINRLEAISKRNDLARMQLQQTRSQIRNHTIAISSILVVGALLIAAGIVLHRSQRRNRQMQANILKLSRKAQESEKMKSNFMNSICHEIRTPFHTLDKSAWRLMAYEMSDQNRADLLNTIRTSTAQLLSTLDNLLEAANLGSLTQPLQFEPNDIHKLCHEQMMAVANDNKNPEIDYKVENLTTPLIVATHSRYFSFVLRAMIENAAKFTQKGCITLDYKILQNKNQLQIRITDTGCGVAPEARANMFSNANNPAVSHSHSLALCYMIAKQMQGEITLDTNYNSGARFIFTIPLKP